MNDDEMLEAKAPLQQSFEAVIIHLAHWSSAEEAADAGVARIGQRIETLSDVGVHTFIVSAADVDDLDARLRARPAGCGRLFLCASRDSEVFEVGRGGPALVTHLPPNAEEEAVFDRAPRASAETAGLCDARSTSGGIPLEIDRADESDAARFAAAWLARRGITGELVLVVGDDFAVASTSGGGGSRLLVPELSRAVVASIGDGRARLEEGVRRLGGGLIALGRLLDEQLTRREERRVPGIDADPRWVLSLPTSRATERVAESLGVLANGAAGVRGAVEEDGAGTTPLFVVSGAYGEDGRLVAGATWTGLDLDLDRHHCGERRLVDLRTGVLVRELAGAPDFRSLRFLSIDEPHAMALRAEARGAVLAAGEPVRPPGDGASFEAISRGEVRVGSSGPASARVAVAAHDGVGSAGDRRVVERLATWATGASGEESVAEAARRLEATRARGFDALLAHQREAWARRWQDALVEIDGSPEDELAARFAVFHLLGAAGDAGEAAVGSRGLTGDAYGGHVFWDAEVYVLPALAAINPPAARAMLEYRIRRLPTARAAALAGGFSGARFPWESAGDGRDVTPREVRGAHGEAISIATGPHEEHIVADVAWAAERYASWTADTALLSGAGRDLVVDTARYWASRVRVDADGRGHLEAVMGPDEYHEVVDDNAYTNVMARWNLRRGAALLAAPGATRKDRATAGAWRRLAAGLVDGWSEQRGVYEQFAGYFEREPLLVADIAPPPVALDVLLGAERVAGSQLIKQLDVLMLHHLVPEETVPGSLGACLAFYEPRTAHGSSLSPAISASLHARAGQPEHALELFRVAARLDLDDLTGTTAGGLHLATMGGVWQALAYGFLGLRAVGDTLGVAPCLPSAWSSLGLHFFYRGRRVTVRATHDEVTVSCDAALSVRLGTRRTVRCAPPGRTFSYNPGAGERSSR